MKEYKMKVKPSIFLSMLSIIPIMIILNYSGISYIVNVIFIIVFPILLHKYLFKTKILLDEEGIIFTGKIIKKKLLWNDILSIELKERVGIYKNILYIRFKNGVIAIGKNFYINEQDLIKSIKFNIEKKGKIYVDNNIYSFFEI